MADVPSAPRLRPVEAFPAVVDGREVVCLRDPSGLTDAVLTVPRPVAEILALLDGTRSIRDVQAEIMRRHGELVLSDQLESLVEVLDRHLFLEGPRLEAEHAQRAAAFRASPLRPAIHAGRAYAGDAEALAAQLESFFLHPEGPGPRGPRRAPVLRGLIAPHIDFHRGGPAYAWAYKAVAEASDADCFIVFGTAHAGLDGHSFAVTAKPYDTPLGPLPVDDEVLHALARRGPGDLFAAELAHRAEHSIEFQAVCLRYLFRDPGAIRIVPILTSFVQECLAHGRDPAAEPAVAGVLDAVRETMAAVPRRYCLVAGADLAHLGPRFGDPEPVSRVRLAQAEAEDRALLSLVASADARGVFAAVAVEGDSRRICGLSPIYALLATLPAGRGRILRYGQWPDPQGTVTFASVAFEDEVP
ncbi:MAG: AmmeMemoRadiSam system protein B [Candidatus Rokubacteria bacterium]|nr:AmmeMemoRadiSam system protein B [Candidatus Rokubacteria bacterium]